MINEIFFLLQFLFSFLIHIRDNNNMCDNEEEIWAATELLHIKNSPPQIKQKPPPNNNNIRIHHTTKRKRMKWSKTQTEELERFFNRCHYPQSQQRTAIAQHYGTHPRSVQVWFQNRRAKYKQQIRESGLFFFFSRKK